MGRRPTQVMLRLMLSGALTVDQLEGAAEKKPTKSRKK
jgi:hypothetical protein